MLIHKIITGIVIQVFDTTTRRFVSQEFVGSQEIVWENPANGDAVEPVVIEGKVPCWPVELNQHGPTTWQKPNWDH